jgi:hypothetical protein
MRTAVEAMERGGHGRPSFFEVTNALAFGSFADRVDYSVIETGMGGLLDSTNTISRTDMGDLHSRGAAAHDKDVVFCGTGRGRRRPRNARR